MGRSHALAYASIPEFEIAAICTRRPESRATLMKELPAGTPEANDYEKVFYKNLNLTQSVSQLIRILIILSRSWHWKQTVMFLQKNL